MKKKVSKINLKRATIAKVNERIVDQIKGGSSLPTDFDEKTLQNDCPSLSL